MSTKSLDEACRRMHEENKNKTSNLIEQQIINKLRGNSKLVEEIIEHSIHSIVDDIIDAKEGDHIDLVRNMVWQSFESLLNSKEVQDMVHKELLRRIETYLQNENTGIFDGILDRLESNIYSSFDSLDMNQILATLLSSIANPKPTKKSKAKK